MNQHSLQRGGLAVTRALPGFSEWLCENPAPDFQALAATYGGLENVPAEAWSEWRRDVDAWRLKLRFRHEPQPDDLINDDEMSRLHHRRPTHDDGDEP